MPGTIGRRTVVRVGRHLREGALIAERYRLEHLLGVGGFAVVWAATHALTRKRVALKFLKDDRALDEPTRRRFLREARAASALAHPHVIAIHDVFEDAQGPVMVMDLLEGESLRERLRQQPVLELGEVSSIVLPVVSALEAASELRLVHRDLKPDNIFLAHSDGADPAALSVKVLDFGIAKFAAREGVAAQSGTLTESGALLGTPYYMSPEQILGDREIDHRSDIWALGVIAYECLAGARPTDGATVGLVISRIIVKESIVSLEQRRPDLPPEVCAIVQRALSFDRAERPTLGEISRVFAPYADPSVRLRSTLTRLAGSGGAARTISVNSRIAPVGRWFGAGAALAAGALALTLFRRAESRVAAGPPAASAVDRDAAAGFRGSVANAGAPASPAASARRGGNLVGGWLFNVEIPGEFEFVVDPEVTHAGHASGSLRSLVSRPNGFSVVMRTASAASYLGKRVRLSGFVKARDVRDWSGLWMRVDGPNGASAFDNMQDNVIDGTRDWTRYAVVLDVAADARDIAFGLLLAGAGHVWVEGMKLEIVGGEVPVTDRVKKEQPAPPASSLPGPPENLDFSLPDSSADLRPGRPDMRPDASAACAGVPPETPFVVGLPSSPGQQPFTATAKGFRAPTVELLDRPGGSPRPLHVVVRTGVAEANRNWSVFGFMFAKVPCLDASRFKGIRFTMQGDLGRCEASFHLFQSHDMKGATGPGICTGERCEGYSFGSPTLTLGTTELSFSELKNGYSDPMDPSALVGMQWGFVAPPSFQCKADLQLSDISFIER
jgi:eukaryotic-like serine/threonine-protein kinase